LFDNTHIDVSFLMCSLLISTILAFVDYEITFDSMQIQAALTWIRRCTSNSW